MDPPAVLAYDPAAPRCGRRHRARPRGGRDLRWHLGRVWEDGQGGGVGEEVCECVREAFSVAHGDGAEAVLCGVGYAGGVDAGLGEGVWNSAVRAAHSACIQSVAHAPCMDSLTPHSSPPLVRSNLLGKPLQHSCNRTGSAETKKHECMSFLWICQNWIAEEDVQLG